MSALPDPATIDAELVERATRGEPEAVEDLLLVLRPLVVRRCARFLPYAEDAEDAAQDALMSIAQHLGEYTGRGSFRGWVTVIASNSARMTYRRLRQRWAESGAAELPEATDPRTTSVVAGTRVDLMEALAQLELHHPRVVEAFVLRDLGSLSYDEIAEVTGSSLAAVRDRIHVARRFMRAAMQTVP